MLADLPGQHAADLPLPEAPAVTRPSWADRQAAADRGDAASGRARSAGPMAAGQASHHAGNRAGPHEGPGPHPGTPDLESGPAEAAPAPARAGQGPTSTVPPNRAAAGHTVPATKVRPLEGVAEPAGQADPSQPPFSSARLSIRASAPGPTAPQPTPTPPHPEVPPWPASAQAAGPDGPASPAGPYRRRFPAAADQAGLAELATDDQAAPPRSGLHGRPDASRRAAAGAGTDEVTVTIGRVEVRVSPPPAQAAAPPGADAARPARPRPSRLEDYLRARASGRAG